MAGNVPGIVPSAALIGSRAIYKPFAFPAQFTKAGDNLGTAINGAVGGIASTLGQAFESLQPRHGMEKLTPIFGKVAEAAQQSEARGQKADAIFWNPFSQGMEGIGRAIAGPGTAFYLHKLGIDQPTEDMIKGVLEMKLFKRPTADEVGGAPAPAPDSEPAPAPEPAPKDDGGGAPAPAPKDDGGGAPAPTDDGGGAPKGGDGGGSPAPNGNGGINPAVLAALRA
jgi:hypothetical protein